MEFLGTWHTCGVLLKAKNLKLKHLRLTFLIVFLLFSFLASTSFVYASPIEYEYNESSGNNSFSVYDTHWVAQTFTVGSTGHTVTSVKVQMWMIGTAGTLTVHIRATNATGGVTGSDLTSGTLSTSGFGGSSPGAMHEVPVTEYTLSANTEYAICCSYSGGSNYLSWYAANPGAYSGGWADRSTNGGSTWDNITYAAYDCYFEVWGNSAGDSAPPTYSSISANTTVAGALCSFNCLVNDGTNVSSYIFSTNSTGTWTNDTATAFSDFFNTTAAWANVTKTLNDTVGNVVSYVWYTNDTSNNWSSSDQYDLTLTVPYRPSLQMTPDNVACRIYLETFSVQINVTNANDAQAFNFTIYYDPQVLNYSSVSWGELGTGTMTEIDTTNGILEGNVAGPPLNGNHWLLNITFQADKAIIWKNPADKLEGKIWFHQAQLNFTDNSTLQYIEGGINQIDVNQAAYTFLPIQGDVNNDGIVDVADIRIIAFYIDKTSGDPDWPAASKYDLNNDNIIDIFDLRVVTANFGFTYP